MTRRSLAGAALAALLLAPAGGSASAQQQTLKPPTLPIAESSLPNGMKIVLVEDHSAPVANVQVWYHVGSKEEKPNQKGFAHLFEHLMFKGSAHVKPQEHAQRITDLGGITNAYTKNDVTVYWETVPSNAIDLALWLEADRMASLTVDEANMKSERQVVIEEKRLRYDNPPLGQLSLLLFDEAYKTHPYRWRPIGSKEDLEAASLADVKAFHDTYYVPNNATLVVAGDFDAKQIAASIQKYFGPIPRGKGELPRWTTPEPPQTAERRLTNYDSKTPLPVVVSAFHIPGAGDPDTYPLEVASLILSGGDSSRLYRDLVYTKQIALQAGGDTFILEDPGLFMFAAFLKPTTKPETGESELEAAMERLKSEPVTQAELDKAKTQLVAGVAIGRASVQAKADAVGDAAVVRGNARLANEELARYQAVTAADIQRVARKYFVKENRSVLYMLPEAMRPKGDAAAAPSGAK